MNETVISPVEARPPAAGESKNSQPMLASASIILSMALVAVGNGLLFAYIPVRLGLEGFAPTWAGSILTGLSAGGIAGCLLTGPLVRRVGHARSYMLLSALIVLANALVAFHVDPLAWIFARALYGFAICALFIVAQSWLNDAVDNAVRGRVMAIFYIAYIVGLGAGAFLLSFADISSAEAPLLGILFTALSMLPVGLTRLAQPPPPEAASVAMRKAWKISPVGIAGMLAVGGLSMMIAGFAPIHATAKGYSQAEVATLLSAMPLGTLVLQFVFGWASDRTDRRIVLAVASLLVAVTGVVAIRLDGAALLTVVAIYMVWGGASDSIYSLSSAHGGDRARKDELLTMSSSMLFAWSLAGFVTPGVGTLLTAVYGTQSFMYITIAIAVVFAAFVAWRILRAPAVPPEETGSFAPMTAQAPAAAELALPQEDGKG